MSRAGAASACNICQALNMLPWEVFYIAQASIGTSKAPWHAPCHTQDWRSAIHHIAVDSLEKHAEVKSTTTLKMKCMNNTCNTLHPDGQAVPVEDTCKTGCMCSACRHYSTCCQQMTTSPIWMAIPCINRDHQLMARVQKSCRVSIPVQALADHFDEARHAGCASRPR